MTNPENGRDIGLELLGIALAVAVLCSAALVFASSWEGRMIADSYMVKTSAGDLVEPGPTKVITVGQEHAIKTAPFFEPEVSTDEDFSTTDDNLSKTSASTGLFIKAASSESQPEPEPEASTTTDEGPTLSFTSHWVGSSATAAPIDGSVGEWLEDWYIVHDWAPVGQAILTLVPGDTVQADGVTYEIADTFDIANIAHFSDVYEIIGRTNVMVLQTCIPCSDNVRIAYAYL